MQNVGRKEFHLSILWYFRYLSSDNAKLPVHMEIGNTFLDCILHKLWWQFSCKEKCTPDSITKFGCEVNINSRQENVFPERWVNWWNPNWEAMRSTLEPSFVILLFLYQRFDLTLKYHKQQLKKKLFAEIISRFSSNVFPTVSNTFWDWLAI